MVTESMINKGGGGATMESICHVKVYWNSLVYFVKKKHIYPEKY